MASEPVLSREVGNRTSFVSQPVMVISAMFVGGFLKLPHYRRLKNWWFLGEIVTEEHNWSRGFIGKQRRDNNKTRESRR